jgi:galactose mutarotase-like enzyme
MTDYGRLDLSQPGGELEVTFLTSLGMVANSLRHRGEELLAQLGGADAYAAKGSTFAIPLLHPYANRLAAWDYEAGGRQVTLDPEAAITHRDTATGLPIHGLLAASGEWTVVDHDGSSVRAELDFGAHPELLAAFPFPHRLTYKADVAADAVTIAVTVTPTSDAPVPIAFGFHPYLTLPGSLRTGWTIELPVRAQALLDEHMIPSGEHVELAPGALDGPLGDRTFDDSYDRLADGVPRFVLADARRRVEMAFLAGYNITQIYTPDGADFICFEPMTAPVNALRSGQGLRFAQPGSDFTAVFRVSVSPVA